MWWFLALYTYISLSFNQWVWLYHYILTYLFHSISGCGYITIYLHISFIQSVGVVISLYTYISLSFNQWVWLYHYILTYLFHSISGCGYITIYLHISFIQSVGVVISLYTYISPAVSHWVVVFHIYTLTFHLQWVTGWMFLVIYTEISHSVSHWVGVSHYRLYTDISPSVSHWVGVSRYILTFHLQWATGWGFLAIYTDISPSVSHCVGVSCYIHWHFTFSEPLGGGFSLYTLIFHIQWVTGWGFLAIYTDISPSVSHWVGVSRYIYRYFTFSEHLGGGFSLYIQICHLQWASGWGFLAIYTAISSSVSHLVGVSRYIHWHFTFCEHLGGGFSLYVQIFHLKWASGWGFLAIYTDMSPSVSIWVGVSRYIYCYFIFCQPLGGGFSLYTLTFHLLWATGWGFLAIYTDISPSVSIWVGVSRYIYRYFTFSEHLGGGFSLYIQICHLQWASGWGFLAIYTAISSSVSHLVGVSRYIHWHFTFCEHLGGGFSLYIQIFHLQWASGWGFLAIYTDMSPSVSIWVGVSRYIYCYFIFCQPLGGGFSLYTLTFHLLWASGWGFLAIYTDISPSVSIWVGVSRYIYRYFTFSEHLGGGFSLYIQICHLQWATGWGFLAIYTDISPSVSHCVGVSCYIHWDFTFSEPLGGGFSLYTLIFHIQWVTGWGFLAIYTDISPSVSHWVGVSRYIYWHFTFCEHLGGGFSLYIQICHLQWASGWGFLAIYTAISSSVSHLVGVSRYIHWHFTFSEPLGGGFSLYILTFHLLWASGWGFLAIYTDISPSVSIWVGVSRYIHWHFTFSEHLGGGFSLYTLTFHLQWATVWGFLAIYTDISPSVSHWVGDSRYIHWYFTFSESLGGGFSQYTLTFHLQWATGWGFLAIYTDISPSVSIWVGVSRYIYRYVTFSEHLGGGFSLYILLFHLLSATWWGFLAIYTDISPSVSIWVGVSRYMYRYFTFSEHLGGGFSLYIQICHLQWASGLGFLAIYTAISSSVSHLVGVSRYIHWHFTFCEHLGGGFSLYILTFHLLWASGWGFLAIYTDISPSVSIWVGVSRYIYSEHLGGGFSLYILLFHLLSHFTFTFCEHLGGGFSLYIQIFHLQWASGWGFLAIYTDISPSVSIWVGVSRYIYCYFIFCQPLGGFSLYTLTFHLLWASGWGFLAIYTDISPSVSIWVGVSRYIYRYFTFSEHLGGGFSLYIQICHLQWATGWGFLAIYTDISPSVSHCVGVSCYIHWDFTFSEPLGGGFSLYTLIFHIQWVTGWGFLAIYTDISPSVSHWVGVSRYIYWHFTFCEHLGGGFSLYIQICHLQWASGWGFLAIYTAISSSVSHLVGVSRYIHWHFTFSEPLGGGFSLYILTFHLLWASGWGFLAIYTDISPSVSIWVGVSRYIHWHFTFSEHLGGGFSLYILTFHLLWASGWGFLAIYTDISPSVSHWVGVSRYIYWHFTFCEHLGGGFSLYIQIFHLQWASGWGFLGIYTAISPSVSHLVGVSRYIHWHFTFSEHLGGVSHYIHWYFTFSESLGGGFSLYTLTFHLQWASGWGFLTIYTAISSSVSHWVGVSRYIYRYFTFSEPLGGGFSLYTLTFHLQWASGCGFLTIYTAISSSVSHWVGVSRYIYRYFTFSEPLGGGFPLYILTYPSVSHRVSVSRYIYLHILQWVTGCRFLAIYTYISPISLCVGDSNYIYFNDENTQQRQWVYCW